MNRFEPFSTHKPWDDLTHQAYLEQPVHNGWHFQLTDKCTAAQKEQWKAWMRKFPDHWPGHVREFVDAIKRKQGST
jgi:hypothetical protein